MKRIMILVVIVLLLVPTLAMAKSSNGATVEEVFCEETGEKIGLRIYVPGKIPAQNGNPDNPAANNPIEVAGT